MCSKSLFFFAVIACLVFPNDSSELLKSVAPSEVILQKFIDLVQTHNLNVSIVTSLNQYWTNGQVQDVRDSGILMPPNNIKITESTLTEQIGKQWINDMQSITVNGKAIASYRVATIQNGNILQTVVESSNEEAIPVSPSYESIVSVQDGIKGIVVEEPDWEIMFNFLVAGKSNQNVQVFAANLNVTLVTKSSSMPVNEITAIQNMLPKMWMMFNDNTIMSQIMVEVLDKQFPQVNWNVVIGPKEVYLDAVKYVVFSVADEYVTIYAIDL